MSDNQVAPSTPNTVPSFDQSIESYVKPTAADSETISENNSVENHTYSSEPHNISMNLAHKARDAVTRPERTAEKHRNSTGKQPKQRQPIERTNLTTTDRPSTTYSC